MWGFIFQRNSNQKKAFAESHQKSPDFDSWAKDVLIRTSFKREKDVSSECNWDNSDSNLRRREFCQKLEGYGRVCHCEYSDKFNVSLKGATPGGVGVLEIYMTGGGGGPTLFFGVENLHARYFFGSSDLSRIFGVLTPSEPFVSGFRCDQRTRKIFIRTSFLFLVSDVCCGKTVNIKKTIQCTFVILFLGWKF